MSEITKGKGMNSGEPERSHKEYVSASDETQAGAKGVLEVGLTRSTEEARESGQREGVSSQAMCLEGTPAIQGDGLWVETKLRRITQLAREDRKNKFTTLAYLLNESFLEQCYWELKKGKASGIDGITVEEYGVNLKENIKGLVRRMKSLQYYPQAVKRVYIPKGDGKLRGLGIPAVEDKIVQEGLRRILEAIYEVDFCDSSYGFRPGRGCHKAVNMLDKTIMTEPINAIVDVDIEKFFDNVDHKWLMKCLEQRIGDPNFLRLIVRFLKAGIIDEGKRIESDKGTPQGGILSPILSNIYLHYVLDLWFEKVARRQVRGHTKLIRYCDDFVVCFEDTESAGKFRGMLKERLEKFGLKIAEDKSRVIEFGRRIWEKTNREGGKPETFDFLGFTHFCDKTRRGKFKVGRKTAKKKFIQKMEAMNKWLKSIRNLVKLPVWWENLKVKLTGHYRYYGVSGNYRMISKFYQETSKLAYKWINRRSQKKSCNYEKYYRHWHTLLPKPKIYHSIYAFSSN